MSKMIKKVISLCLVLLCVGLLCSCKKNDKTKITIIQYVSASALDDACDGIVEGLKEAGFIDGENVEITIQNPQGDPSTLSIMAKDAVRNSDMIFAIATPAALAVQNECKKQKSDVPVLFTAVTDPVSVGLVASNEAPGANITGTNDMNPVKEQVALLKEMKKDAKKIGVLYTSSEPNSTIQVNLVKEMAKEEGLEVVSQSLTSINDVKVMINALISEGVDAIYLPTDNNIASSIETVTNLTNKAGIPTICGEEGMIFGGGTITLGINYFNLGKMTGQMAANVLNGADISTLPVQGLVNFNLVINKKKATENNIIIPEELLARADNIIE